MLKRKKEAGEKLILVKTGRLRDSFKPGRLSGNSYSPSNDDQIYESLRGRVLLGSNVPYAKIHDPERPLLGNEKELVEYAIGEAYIALMKELQKVIK